MLFVGNRCAGPLSKRAGLLAFFALGFVVKGLEGGGAPLPPAALSEDPAALSEDPVLRAAMLGDVEEIRRRLNLANGGKCSRKGCGDNTDGETSLHRASRLGQAGAVKAILAAGGDKDGQNRYGSTPLHVAARAGHSNVVKVLLAAGCDKNKLENDGQTPLYAASKAGHADVVDLLVAAGANLDKRNDYGVTAIHAAARGGKAAAVKVLVEGGAEKNKIDNKRDTPLASAKDPRLKADAHTRVTWDPKAAHKEDGTYELSGGVGWSQTAHVDTKKHEGHPKVVQNLMQQRGGGPVDPKVGTRVPRERDEKWAGYPGEAIRRPALAPL